MLHENRSAKFVLSMIHPSSTFQSRLSIVQSVLSMDHLSFPNGPLRSAMPLQIVVVISRSPLRTHGSILRCNESDSTQHDERTGVGPVRLFDIQTNGDPVLLAADFAALNCEIYLWASGAPVSRSPHGSRDDLR